MIFVRVAGVGVMTGGACESDAAVECHIQDRGLDREREMNAPYYQQSNVSTLSPDY